MCGICGKYFFLDKPVEQEIMIKMTRSLYSRGPDDEKIFIKRNAGLGVRRLSIIDKEQGGQPMFNEDKTVCFIYNGEIYNYKELKDYLLNKGHVFFTKCDGEVISHLYEEYGLMFLQKLHGMFAIALLDLKENKLILARDRIGIKPLYFFKHDDYIVFSSSIKSLIQDNAVSLDLDYRGINCYFSYSYFPGNYSPFINIKKLLPGSYLVCDINGVNINYYCHLHYKNNNADQSDTDYVDEFRDIFERAVKRHLTADVPMGIFLSGGLDSSSLAYFANRFRDNLYTFSIGIGESTYNEYSYANLVSRYIGTRHYEINITKDLPGLVKMMSSALDIPIGDPSFIPTFQLCEFAKNFSGVILSGEGADELFGGYETYKADILANYFINFTLPFEWKLLLQLVKKLPVSYKRLNFKSKSELFLKGLTRVNRISHYTWREIFSEEEKKMLYSRDFFSQLSNSNFIEEPYELFKEYFYAINSNNFLERSMYFDIKEWLTNSILSRVDAASMFHALEVRVPYLDDELVELSFRLPLDKKIYKMRGKYLLREAFKDKLPKKILRRPKQGFSVPIGKWLRYELNEFCLELFSNLPKQIDTILNRNYVSLLFNEHRKGNQDHGRKLWNIIIFTIWFNEFVSGKNNR